tara:strand:+ start:2987 stop:3568 length:582 start_codon:yes stop_codon:yes gene_type:complete
MINIHELNTRRREKRKRDCEIYKRVLKRCHLRIRMSANQLASSCSYNVPSYIPGLPLFEISSCVRYLKKKLIKNGFKVILLSRLQLHISWKHIPLDDDDDDDVGKYEYMNNKINHSIPYTNTQNTNFEQHQLHPSNTLHPSNNTTIFQQPSTLPQTSYIPPPPRRGFNTDDIPSYRDIKDEIIKADSILFNMK